MDVSDIVSNNTWQCSSDSIRNIIGYPPKRLCLKVKKKKKSVFKSFSSFFYLYRVQLPYSLQNSIFPLQLQVWIKVAEGVSYINQSLFRENDSHCYVQKCLWIPAAQLSFSSLEFHTNWMSFFYSRAYWADMWQIIETGPGNGFI